MSKSLPSRFTHLAELQVDWQRVLGRIPLQYRGLIALVDRTHLAVYESSFKYPVLAIPHEEYTALNQRIELLASITTALNQQLVHKFSGIRFVEPLQPKIQELINTLIANFDVQTVDIIDSTCNLTLEEPVVKESIDTSFDRSSFDDIIFNEELISNYIEEYQDE